MKIHKIDRQTDIFKITFTLEQEKDQDLLKQVIKNYLSIEYSEVLQSFPYEKYFLNKEYSIAYKLKKHLEVI